MTQKKHLLAMKLLLCLFALLTASTAWAEKLTINSADDWNAFAGMVGGGTTYQGDTVLLANDITVSTMVGDNNHKFSGTFIGCGHTLTFNATATGNDCAPFNYIDGATIKFLNVAGTISSGYKYAAGIAAHSSGNCTIESCHSSVNIVSSVNGDGTHAGFVAVHESGSTLNITNCLFDGSISGNMTTNCGGFVGWRNGTLSFTNCVMAGAMDIDKDSGSSTFSRNNNPTLSNCYYDASRDYGTMIKQGSATNLKNSICLNDLGDHWQMSDNGVTPLMDFKNFIFVKFIVNAYNTYTGAPLYPEPKLVDVTGKVLTKDVDYTVEWSGDGSQMGEYTMTVTGISPYSGTLSAGYSVVSNELGENATWAYDSETNTLTISPKPGGTGVIPDFSADVNWSGQDPRPYAGLREICEHIFIEDGITTVGAYSLARLGKVSTLRLPASLTSIKNSAFFVPEKSNSMVVTIEDGRQLASIGEAAFCFSKAVIDLRPCTLLTSIANAAFSGCDEVILPYTVNTLQTEAVRWTDVIKIAPREGHGLVVEGTPVELGADSLYNIGSLIRNISSPITLNWVSPYNLNFGTLALSNAKKNNWYAYQNGEAISIETLVKNPNDVVVTKGTDYTVSITDSLNNPVTSVTNKGVYTLTITGTGTEESGYFGSLQTTFAVEGPVTLTAETKTWQDGHVYNIDGEMTIDGRVTVDGFATLNLREGSNLTVTGGIGVNEGNGLIINGPGTLTANSTEGYYAGIGGDKSKSAGVITINGATVTATGGDCAAGIGGGFYSYHDNAGGDCGTITINNAVVNATGGAFFNGSSLLTAAIGLGRFIDYNIQSNPLPLKGSITINGGQVTATGAIGFSTKMGQNVKCDVTLNWNDKDNDFIESDNACGGTFTFTKSFQYDDNGTAVLVTAENIGSLAGKRLTPYAVNVHTATFETGEDATTVQRQTLVEGQTVTYPATPMRKGYRFSKWINGSQEYDFSAPLTKDITLTAVWKPLPDIQYLNTNNTLETISGADYYPLEPSCTTLNSGTWVLMDSVTTFTERIITVNNVTLILSDGKKLVAQKGISVTEYDRSQLSIMAQSGGTGALTVTGINTYGDACIGGTRADLRYNCGTVNIYGGQITTSRINSSVGIGGAAGYGSGGNINILGGQVEICSSWGNAVGYGYNVSGAHQVANITLGWRNPTDYIKLEGYSGTATLVSDFLIDGTTTKARCDSVVNNISNQKLVPNTTGVLNWSDVKAALEAGKHVTLVNDVVSEEGDETITIHEDIAASINLNGHTLSHQHSTVAEKKNVFYVMPDGSLTISDGSTGKTGRITGNNAGIANCGTVTISDITLSGFGAKDSLCYAIDNQGTMNLTNVCMTGNTGGGLFTTSPFVTNIAGRIIITGNKRLVEGELVDRDLSCSENIINISGPLTADSRIGVSVGKGILTSGAKGNAVLTNFISEDTQKYISWTTDGEEIQYDDYYNMTEDDGMTDLVNCHQGETIPVRFTRPLTNNTPVTLCMPFIINAMTYKDNGSFYSFNGVDETTTPWTVNMSQFTSYAYDGTPVLFVPETTDSLTFYPQGNNLVVGSEYTPGTVTVGNWSFTGTYEKKQWDATHNTDEIGTIYGFAAQAGTSTDSKNADIEAGKFFRVAGGANSYILPFRAYLKYNPSNNAPAFGNTQSTSSDNLPEKMIVRLIGADGETTGIGTFDTRTGEFSFDNEAWYTLDGRRLNGKPAAKGVYIYKGKKVKM